MGDHKQEEQEQEGQVRMEHILEETVPTEDLKKFEQKYHTELQAGQVWQ